MQDKQNDQLLKNLVMQILLLERQASKDPSKRQIDIVNGIKKIIDREVNDAN